MHYGLSTNEFVKHGSLSESKANVRSLRSFLQRHRFNDLFEIFGKENLEEYYDLRIFDSTKDHKETLSRQISSNFNGIIEKVEHRRKMIKKYSLGLDHFKTDQIETEEIPLTLDGKPIEMMITKG